MSNKTLFAHIVAASAMSSTGIALATPTFTALGDMPGGTFVSFAMGVSADGKTVVGLSDAESGDQAFRWTANDGMVGLGSGGAYDVSADGTVIVGQSIDGQSGEAFRWTSENGMTVLRTAVGSPPPTAALGVSGDGSKVVGIIWNFAGVGGYEPFLWTAQTDAVSLGYLPGGNSSDNTYAYDVSTDGSTVVGISNSLSGYQAFRWTAEGGMVGLGYLPGATQNYSQGYATSADGSVVVGTAVNKISGKEAFRWTADGGMVGLGDLNGGSFHSEAKAVSADGLIVVGMGLSSSGMESFIWDATRGIRDLDQVLTNDYGLDLSGWTGLRATALSADGLVIVGWGNHNGNLEGWIADLHQGDVCLSGCPYNTIQSAIDAAEPGAIINVDPGTYHERLKIDKPVTVQTVQSLGNTIIDATGLGGSAVTIGAGATLKGFTVTGGQASDGGGIYVNGKAYIRSNVIRGNSASHNGGGIYVQSHAEITGNDIASNSAAVYGGGIAIDRDYATVSVKHNILRGNTADYGGGLAINSAYVTIGIEDNIFRENSAVSNVSAMNLPTTAIMVIDGNTFYKNLGIAVYAHPNSTAVMKNALLIGNGTAIHMAPGAQVKVINSTIVNNEKGVSAGNPCQGPCPEVINSIFWTNVVNIAGSLDVSYSLLGAWHAGVGNIVANPVFVDAASGNFNVMAFSPAIDAGKDVSGYGVTVDYANATRPQDGDGMGAGAKGDGSDYDIGAYEYVRP